MKKQILFFLFFSFTHLSLNSQCNIPFPPAMTCDDAPVICGLDGYCTTLFNSNFIDQPSTFCGSISNNQWIAFVAGSTTLSLEVVVGNCQGTQNGIGLQAHVYSACEEPWTTASNCLFEVFPNSSEELIMPSLTVGNVYYLMTDGFLNDICDYQIFVNSGSTTPPIPDPAGPIVGTSEICLGSTFDYCVPPSFAANSYDWTIPPGATTLGNTNGDCIIIDFSGMATSNGTITVTPINDCGVGISSSFDVQLGAPITGSPVDFVLCEGDAEVYGNTTYAIEGTFLNTDLTNSDGCIIETIVNVEVIPVTNFTYLDEVICEGEMSSTGETTSDIYTYNFSTPAMGCDSTVVLDLTVLNPTSGILPVMDTINNIGDTIKIEAVVNNPDPSISYIWTGPCIDPNTTNNNTVVEVSCGGVYELQLSQTLNGVTCLSPIYSVTIIDNTSTGGDCPDDIVGFTALGEFEGSKYYISNDDLQPVPAEALVETFGGHITTINSQEENDFIQQNISEMVYIGLNDFELEGNLVWENGEPLTYDNIDPCSFCNENSDDQDFVIIAPWDGAWSFSNFYNSRKVIMEIPCGVVNPTTEITINCTDDITVVLPSGDATVEVNYSTPTASSTCGGLVFIDRISGPPTGTLMGAGVIEMEFEVTDSCGNVEYCEFLITVEPEVVMGDCPDDIAGFTTLGEFGNSKYYLSDDISRPLDAQAEAESYGGYIVSIGSQEENDFIQQNIPEMVHIGLNDFDVEGELVWFNGEPLDYENIDPCDFCNENSDDQDFVIIAPWDGAWSFSNFYNNRKYVMEIPCSQTLTDPNIGNSFASQNLNKVSKPSLEGLVPNPASDFIFVKINTPQEMEIEMLIYNARGVLVKSEKVTLYEGRNSSRLEVVDLANGFYSIYIPQAEIEFATQRFVKVGE